MRHIQHFTKSIRIFSPITVHLIFIKCDASSVLNTFVLACCPLFLPFDYHCLFTLLAHSLSLSISLHVSSLISVVWQRNFDAMPLNVVNNQPVKWARFYNIEEEKKKHLKMDNGENIYRNPNVFNSKRIGYSISFIIFHRHAEILLELMRWCVCVLFDAFDVCDFDCHLSFVSVKLVSFFLWITKWCLGLWYLQMIIWSWKLCLALPLRLMSSSSLTPSVKDLSRCQFHTFTFIFLVEYFLHSSGFHLSPAHIFTIR